MKREFGSEFWDVPIKEYNESFFSENVQWFISGRIALHYIIKDILIKKKINRVALPSWCCDSMIQPFLYYNIEVVFYSITLNKENGIVQSIQDVSNCDAILVMDYFGYNNLPSFQFDGIVIYDATHSIFTNYIKDADYTFGSLRKWTGFYTGGFAYSKEGFQAELLLKKESVFEKLRREAMSLKSKYIRDGRGDKTYRDLFNEAENFLDSISLEGQMYSATERDIEKARHLDVSYIKKQRVKNAKVIHKKLCKYTIFKELKESDCPLFIPIILPNSTRDELKKYLISKKIYCPIHWPISELHVLDEETKKIYDSELSIICDQRYNELEMKEMCKEICVFLDRF